MAAELGIIEGFYGRPWSWADRRATVEALKPHGYGFYLYAPKADPWLRRRWKEPYPEAAAGDLEEFAAWCRHQGVRFGVGLTPYDLHKQFDAAGREALQAKLDLFGRIGVDDLGILFDDMRGDLPDLAKRQVEIVEWITERSPASRHFVCPSYYSNDPVLDRVFGSRPQGYLEELGRSLAEGIEIFWTGEEVCSREYTVGHLEEVGRLLRRKPFLWDNYPVNDGQRMSQYLHLRGFTGRPARLEDAIAGHGINPALQPTLSRIPAITLAVSYREGERYSYGQAMRAAAIEIAGEELGPMLYEDVLVLQDVGLDRLGEKEERLRERYGGREHPAAREVIGWLDGEYRITDEIVQTQ